MMIVFGFNIQLELEELNIIIKMFVINRFLINNLLAIVFKITNKSKKSCKKNIHSSQLEECRNCRKTTIYYEPLSTNWGEDSFVLSGPNWSCGRCCAGLHQDRGSIWAVV